MSVLILVIDDEPDVASLFQQQFRRELRSGRLLMKFASSATEALERIAVPEDASLILVFSDINMPGMSGLELLPKIKAARPDVPVIMITAYGDADTRRKALEGGSAGLLTKPIDFAALRQEVAGSGARSQRCSRTLPSSRPLPRRPERPRRAAQRLPPGHDGRGVRARRHRHEDRRRRDPRPLRAAERSARPRDAGSRLCARAQRLRAIVPGALAG